MRFLVDMPLSPALTSALATRGHDAVHASALGLDRAPDAEILARAGQDGRTVITVDLDYPRLLALAGAAGPNLILFRAGDWSEAEVVARMQQLSTISVRTIDRHAFLLLAVPRIARALRQR